MTVQRSGGCSSVGSSSSMRATLLSPAWLMAFAVGVTIGLCLSLPMPGGNYYHHHGGGQHPLELARVRPPSATLGDEGADDPYLSPPSYRMRGTETSSNQKRQGRSEDDDAASPTPRTCLQRIERLEKELQDATEHQRLRHESGCRVELAAVGEAMDKRVAEMRREFAKPSPENQRRLRACEEELAGLGRKDLRARLLGPHPGLGLRAVGVAMGDEEGGEGGNGTAPKLPLTQLLFGDMAMPRAREGSLLLVTDSSSSSSPPPPPGGARRAAEEAAAYLNNGGGGKREKRKRKKAGEAETEKAAEGAISAEEFALACGGQVTAIMAGTVRCYVGLPGFATTAVDTVAEKQGEPPASPPLPHHHRFLHKLTTRNADLSKDLGMWRRLQRIPHEGRTPPLRYNTDKHDAFLAQLLQAQDELLAAARPVVEQAADADGVVTVMAVTQGDLDLLANFACSLQANGVDASNILVVGGDEIVSEVAGRLGFHAFTHPALGDIPSKHSEHYGDATFLAVMWLKSLSAWLVSRLGYHLLFQDVDLVWFRDPVRELLLHDPDPRDAYFMDDGARSERFAPYFANSGFFFLRHNARTRHFLESMLFAQDLVIQWGSHQSVFIQMLEQHVLRHGLSVRILDQQQFPGGYMFHYEREALMASIHGRREGEKKALPGHKPLAFHINWTQYKHEKLRYLKEAALWYTDEQACSQEAILRSLVGGFSSGRGGSKAKRASADGLSRALCCRVPDPPPPAQSLPAPGPNDDGGAVEEELI